GRSQYRRSCCPGRRARLPKNGSTKSWSDCSRRKGGNESSSATRTMGCGFNSPRRVAMSYSNSSAGSERFALRAGRRPRGGAPSPKVDVSRSPTPWIFAPFLQSRRLRRPSFSARVPRHMHGCRGLGSGKAEGGEEVDLGGGSMGHEVSHG